MNKYLAAVLIVAMIALAIVSIANAQPQEPIELQPYWILMDGEEKVGLVYGLDWGSLVVKDDNLLYTCGCDECTPDEVGYLVPENTPGPHDTPVPNDTPVPTDPPPVDTPIPPEPVVRCDAGGGNGSEGDPDCDPGNSGEHNQAGD